LSVTDYGLARESPDNRAEMPFYYQMRRKTSDQAVACRSAGRPVAGG